MKKTDLEKSALICTGHSPALGINSEMPSKKKVALQLSQDENLDYKRLVDAISNYLFT